MKKLLIKWLMPTNLELRKIVGKELLNAMAGKHDTDEEHTFIGVESKNIFHKVVECYVYRELKKIKDDLDVKISQEISGISKDERFLDEIIERIKRKQL